MRSVEKDRCMPLTSLAKKRSLTVADAATEPSDRRILSMITGQVVVSSALVVLVSSPCWASTPSTR